jgi:cystathionine beta-lyase/cystathionine gamma-synthase
MDPEVRVETLCIQAREALPAENRPLVAPIYQTAVWSLEGAEQCEAVYTGEVPGFIYTRDANPNHRALEGVIAGLEHARGAVVFGSGMAAIAGSITALAKSGGRILASSKLYGVSVRLLTEELSRFGIATDWVDIKDHATVNRELEKGADLLLVETLSNPTLEVANLDRLGSMCAKHRVPLVVDSTFASPLVCRPLDFNAAVVVHSVTKVLGGHSDLTLGAAAANDPAILDGLRRHAVRWGGNANPFESWLAVRGIATYPLRIERSCANAQVLAERLEGHAAVPRVYYPGLTSHPQHALAKEILICGGHMLSFEVADGEAASRFLGALTHVRFAPSLGDVATTVSYPVATSQRGLAPEAVAAMGITPGTLRLSVGIDHVEDVWSDLSRALG